ncbi:MAG: PDZ domain-containing protein, partial [Planctomycetes bacterium]|nr:PDZ domain-containing protein [Planctomycetota bacterium]
RWATASETPGRVTQVRGFLNPRQIAAQLAALQPLLLADDSELLRSEWFQNLRDYFQATPVRLGARLRKDNSQTPGKVYVMRTLEGRPAHGKLRPGDYILGIDGELLSLEAPKEDLRQKLQAKPSGGLRTLRIERHGRVSDVEIYLPKPSPQSLRGLLVGTGNAIQLLADLGNVVERITYRQFGAKPFELQAEIILKLRDAGSNE